MFRLWLCFPQDAKSDDNELATDNALSALAALLEHHGDVLDAGQVRRLAANMEFAELSCKADGYVHTFQHVSNGWEWAWHVGGVCC